MLTASRNSSRPASALSVIHAVSRALIRAVETGGGLNGTAKMAVWLNTWGCAASDFFLSWCSSFCFCHLTCRLPPFCLLRVMITMKEVAGQHIPRYGSRIHLLWCLEYLVPRKRANGGSIHTGGGPLRHYYRWFLHGRNRAANNGVQVLYRRNDDPLACTAEQGSLLIGADCTALGEVCVWAVFHSRGRTAQKKLGGHTQFCVSSEEEWK